MHPRRPHAEKPPLGDQGEVARRSRDGGDQKRRGPEAYNPSVSLRLTAPFAQGSLFSQASRTCGRRTALHTEAGGPMWASAPTRETVELRCESEPGFGRPYRPHLGTTIGPISVQNISGPNRGRIVVSYTYRWVTTSMTPRVVRRRVGITGRAISSGS